MHTRPVTVLIDFICLSLSLLVMRIASIIVDQEPTISSYLKKCLGARFPEILICGEATSYMEACELIRNTHPALVFSDVSVFDKRTQPTAQENANDYEIIYTSDKTEDAISAIHQDACGFILKPLNVNDIVVAVGSAIRKFSQRTFYRMAASSPQEATTLPHTRLFGIPTLEGIDFLYVHEIVRCE